MENVYGPQSSGDNLFTRKARLLQSHYRVNNTNEAMGTGPLTSSTSHYGNMLVNGESSGKNFFFKETFEYAAKRVMEKKPAETIDAFRLFNNMLSSMPMAFNLFHPLMMIKEKYPDVINKMIQDTFPALSVFAVEDVKIEFIPTPVTNYTNDKSAMDAAVFFKDENGEQYLISIELKYTDCLGTNKAKNNLLKFEFAKNLTQFTDEGLKLIENGCNQIYRNYLLTEKYRVVHKLKDSYSIILAPAQHPSTEKEINSLKNNLKPEYHHKIMKYDLESFMNNLKKNCPDELKNWLENFYNRYLNFAVVDNLLKGTV